MVADVAEALHGDRLPAEAVVAELGLGGGLDPSIGTVRRDGRGVTGGTGPTGNVFGFHVDELHVVHGCADVLGGDVAALETLHEAAVRPEQHLAACGTRVADHDRLAAAEVQPGNGGLVRHPPGKAEDVDDRFLVGCIVPEAGSAQSRAERRVVDRDDPLVSARRLGAEDHLLVTAFLEGFENFHALGVA